MRYDSLLIKYQKTSICSCMHLVWFETDHLRVISDSFCHLLWRKKRHCRPSCRNSRRCFAYFYCMLSDVLKLSSFPHCRAPYTIIYDWIGTLCMIFVFFLSCENTSSLLDLKRCLWLMYYVLSFCDNFGIVVQNCIALHCAVWYVVTWYDVLWYDMIWYDMIWYDMIWYDMIWHYMISNYAISLQKYLTSIYVNKEAPYYFSQEKKSLFFVVKA